MTRNFSTLLSIIASGTGLLAFGWTSASAQPSRPVLVIRQTAQPPVIDGKLDDACWQDAPVITNFTQVLPVEDSPPSERTEVRFLYTTHYLYIGVRCFDSEPDKIIAKQMQRDGLFESDDRVKIAFDTFFRQRDGYFFAVNPAGARTDGLIENFSNQNRLWDALWQSRARIDDSGWTAEIAIPFKSLSFDPHRDSWGCNIERVIRRKQEIVRWTALARAKPMSSLSDFGELRGNTKLTAALSAITAAVVGVVLNLAVWFGLHVLFPAGQLVNWFGIVVGLLSFAGMVKWKWGVIPVVLGAGALGLIYKLVLPQ